MTHCSYHHHRQHKILSSVAHSSVVACSEAAKVLLALFGDLCWADQQQQQRPSVGHADELCRVSCSDEKGACYAIDVGGTNFRVVYYKLSDKRGQIVSGHSTSMSLFLSNGQ